MRLLVSDVGGTHVRLALVEVSAPSSGNPRPALKITEQETYLSRDFPALEPAIQRFIERHPLPFEGAAFAVAGPVQGQVAKLSNLDWKIEARDLLGLLKLESVYLLNDLEAQAYGLGDLSAEDLVMLQEGKRDPLGNAALLAPGTGLGKATVYRGDGESRVLKSEGGHADFGARTSDELELLQCLAAEHGHVSWERVLSGPGLVEIYRFLRRKNDTPEPESMRQAFAKESPALVISRNGLQGREPVSAEALKWFVRFLASQAATTALDSFATGGLFLGGGIVPHLIPLLRRPEFLNEFLQKGRMQPLLETIPIAVVQQKQLGLLGAARFILSQSHREMAKERSPA